MSQLPPSSTDATKEIFEHTLSPLVKVIVGKGNTQEIHHLHSSLLCAQSEYFRGCLSSGFSESATGQVDLTDEDLMAFRYFVKWIYSSDIAPFPTLRPMGVVDAMIDVYVLGDRILCDSLKNRAMDMVQAACMRSSVAVDSVLKAVRKGDSGSKMTEYLLKQLARDIWGAVGYEEYMAMPSWQDLLAADAQATATLMHEVVAWKSAD